MKPTEKKEEAGKEPEAGPSTPSSTSSSLTSENKDDDSAIEQIRRYMAEKLGFHDNKDSEKEEKKKKKRKVLEECTIDGIVSYMLSDACKKVIVMTGAGISTSAGIPDFRSPGSGLYDNLEQYNLPHPQAIFEIDYFRQQPEPFFKLAQKLFPAESYKPTPSHYFIRLLHEKELLLRNFTQNIDGLEKTAGVPEEKVVEAHGTFYTSHCLECKKEFDLNWLKTKISKDLVPKCDACPGIVKPDIVFFGENLPERFFRLVRKDFPQADLLIIMGSSLVVQPFCSLIDHVRSHVPRLLINREKAGTRSRVMALLDLGGGLDFEANLRDVAYLGDCDLLVRELVEKLGWKEEFLKLMEES